MIMRFVDSQRTSSSPKGKHTATGKHAEPSVTVGIDLDTKHKKCMKNFTFSFQKGTRLQ